MQAEHAVEFWVAAYVPAEHTVHTVEPVLAAALPNAHKEQKLWMDMLLKDPAGQLWHTTAPDKAKVPGTHAVQPIDACNGAARPTSHTAHSVCPTLPLDRPSAQSWHADAVTLAKRPALQVTQREEPGSEEAPTAQT